MSRASPPSLKTREIYTSVKVLSVRATKGGSVFSSYITSDSSGYIGGKFGFGYVIILTNEVLFRIY
jgi:hypothetical protein